MHSAGDQQATATATSFPLSNTHMQSHSISGGMIISEYCYCVIKVLFYLAIEFVGSAILHLLSGIIIHYAKL